MKTADGGLVGLLCRTWGRSCPFPQLPLEEDFNEASSVLVINLTFVGLLMGSSVNALLPSECEGVDCALLTCAHKVGSLKGGAFSCSATDPAGVHTGLPLVNWAIPTGVILPPLLGKR